MNQLGAANSRLPALARAAKPFSAAGSDHARDFPLLSGLNFGAKLSMVQQPADQISTNLMFYIYIYI